MPMERIWLKSYPQGVPPEIDIQQYQSVAQVFDESVQRFATRTAYTCMDKSISYRELDELTGAFASFLQARGLRKGTRVALMMPNILQYPITLFGILRAG